MGQNKLKDIIKRIERLEKAVFVSNKPSLKKVKADNFSGATGGLRLLVSEGFFDNKRSFGEIKTELSKKGYNYSRQAIQTPLNKLSKNGGLLVGLEEKGKKAYAKRK